MNDDRVFSKAGETYRIEGHQAVKVFNYKPKEDITVYELACIMPFFLGVPMTPQAMANLGLGARHFEEVEQSPLLVPPTRPLIG